MSSAAVVRVVLVAAILLLASFGRALDTGDLAPDFRSADLRDGKAVSLSKLKGKVVLIDIWATWCPPCRMEIPHFISLQKKYRHQGLRILGIAMDKDADTARRFAVSAKFNYLLIHDNGLITSLYGDIRYLPTGFLVGRDGKVIKQYVGYRPPEEFERDIAEALKSPK
jgi:cytochrome c biogenesis protein CcmG/thiol:disulfide interchange protein DsbE